MGGDFWHFATVVLGTIVAAFSGLFARVAILAVERAEDRITDLERQVAEDGRILSILKDRCDRFDHRET